MTTYPESAIDSSFPEPQGALRATAGDRERTYWSAYRAAYVAVAGPKRPIVILLDELLIGLDNARPDALIRNSTPRPAGYATESTPA